MLKKEENYWIVPKNIKDIYMQGHLGAHIRRQLLNNHLVSNLIQTLSANSISFEKLVKIIKSHFPYVDASESTWNSYANALIAWLEASRIIQRNARSIIELTDFQSEEFNFKESLGNLLDTASRKRGRSILQYKYFIPSTTWDNIEGCFEQIKNGQVDLQGEYRKAYGDLKNCGIIDLIDKIPDVESLKTTILKDYFQTDEYKNIWNAAENGGNILQEVSRLIAIQMTDSTLLWRAKRMINCGKALGLIKKQRYSLKTGVNRHSSIESFVYKIELQIKQDTFMVSCLFLG